MTISRSRIRRSARAGLATLALAGALAPAASAGTYHVYACKTPSGVIAPWNDWTGIGRPGDNLNAGCQGANGEQTDDMRAYASATYDNFAGSRVGWSFTAPADTTIASATFQRTLYNSREGNITRDTDWAAWIGVNGPSVADGIEVCKSGCQGVGYASSPVNPNPTFASGQLDGSVKTIYAMAGCVGTGPSCPSSQTFSWYGSVAIQRSDIEIRDDNPPSATSVTGALAATAAHKGIESLGFTAKDKGGGLYTTTLELKPAAGEQWTTAITQRVDANGGKCAEVDSLTDTDNEFASSLPCKLQGDQQLSLDTARYPDGNYQLRVRLEDAAGNLGTVVDQPFAIDNVPPPANTVAPSVSGLPRDGQVLTSNVGQWNGQNLTYVRQWERCDDQNACASIAGATGDTYPVTTSDAGYGLRVVVTASNDQGATAAASAKTAKVLLVPANTVKPVITGAAKLGETLTTSTGNWTDADPDDYRYQWQRCTGRGTKLDCRAIDGAGLTTYKPVMADVDKTLRAVITATGPGGSGSQATELTSAVVDKDPGADQPCQIKCTTEPPPCTSCDPTQPNGNGGKPDTARFTATSRRTVRVRYGVERAITGRLVDAGGTAITGAVLDVVDGDTRSTLTTDGRGTYRYALRRGVSRTITFAYRATLGAASYQDTAAVIVQVGGVIRLRARDATVARNGTMRLAGRVLGAGQGATIQIQARDGRRWRTIDVTRTDAKGRIAYAYTFKRVTHATFLFRAKMGDDAKVRLGAAISKAVTVRVR